MIDSGINETSRHRHLLDALILHATERPDADAIADRCARTLTWGQLAHAVVEQSKRNESLPTIAHEIRNEIDDVVMALGCLASGTMEIAIDARLSLAVRTRMLEVAGVELAAKPTEPTALAAGSEDACGKSRGPKASTASNLDLTLDRLRQLAANIDVRQPSLVLWTSGTTSDPKGVMLSAQALVTNATAKLIAVPQGRQSRRLTVLPISHAYARTCDMGTWLLSGCHWTLDLGMSALHRIDPDRPPTDINCVPLIANEIEKRLDEQDPRFSELRILGCGGAAMPESQFNRFRSRGIEVIQGYGCTESAPVICSASPGQTRAGYVGHLVEGWESSIRSGRLYVRGESTMIGYLNDPVASAKKLSQDGWLDTGDLVEQDDDGTFRILGRADDVIVLGNGYKIDPQSIELRLREFGGVEHAVVLEIDGRVLVAIQGRLDQNANVVLYEQLPPGTSFEIVPLEPPLSHDRDEITPKGTPRRSRVRERLRKMG